MSATQLERSVLEAKEREELFAIAAALGTKAAARSKKADLITQILRATGVEESGVEPEEKPKRTRARKAPATATSSDDVALTDVGAEDEGSRQLKFSPVADAVAAATSEASMAPTAGPRRRASGPRSTAVAARAAANAAAVSADDSTAPVAVTESNGTRSRSNALQSETGDETPAAEDAPRRATGPTRSGPRAGGLGRTRPAEADGAAAAGSSYGSSGASRPDVTAGPSGSPEAEGRPGAEARTTDSRTASEARPGTDGRTASEARPGTDGRSGGEANGRSGSGQHVDGASSGQNGPTDSGQGRGGSQGRQHSGQPQGSPSSTQPSGGRTSGANSQGQPQGESAQGGPGGPQSRFDAEPGNRRNRRRRGRDRPERTEREPQAQAAPPENQPFSGEPVDVTGFLDLRDEGYGFLRTDGFLASQNDVYVSISQVRRFAMRKGDFVQGASRPPGSNEKYPALLRVDTVSGLTPEEARNRPRFESLTPLFPDSKLRLEMPGDPANLTARIVDLISPIGKGQRGLIVSPPKAGKTTVLKQIAHSIEANNPEVHLMVLLVDERPEEVTDMRRSVKGEVIASTFDRPSDEHTQVAELAIERAKRLVEVGRDVVIVLDGITRLARAYNLAQPATGRIMSGGIDTGALYPPKKFFGAARNIEEGGSLTILATALVETGSKMDEVIFEEFKGTGNMELRLDRRLAERRIYPAIDVNGSSTRHEELLFDRTHLQQVWKLRRVLGALGSEGSHAAGLELLIDRIKMTRSNDEFLAEIAKNPAPNV